jgi:hypothetical protein
MPYRYGKAPLGMRLARRPRLVMFLARVFVWAVKR